MKKYILFDLDGTLTESAPGIIRSVKYALDRLAVGEYDENLLLKFVGPPLAESFKKFFGFSDEKALKAIDIYREYFSQKGLFENSVYSGIPQTLARLHDCGIKLAVATSKPEVFAEKILRHFSLADYFEHICGIPLEDEKMTKSQVVAVALDKLGVSDKSLAVMVGDRDYDAFGAHENQIECIGVTYGYGTEYELRCAGAEYIAFCPAGIADIIENMNR